MKDKNDLTYLVKKYGPGFVAVSKKNGHVRAFGRDIKKMFQQAEKKGIDFSKVIISYVPRYGVRSVY